MSESQDYFPPGVEPPAQDKAVDSDFIPAEPKGEAVNAVISPEISPEVIAPEPIVDEIQAEAPTVSELIEEVKAEKKKGGRPKGSKNSKRGKKPWKKK